MTDLNLKVVLVLNHILHSFSDLKVSNIYMGTVRVQMILAFVANAKLQNFT